MPLYMPNSPWSIVSLLDGPPFHRNLERILPFGPWLLTILDHSNTRTFWKHLEPCHFGIMRCILDITVIFLEQAKLLRGLQDLAHEIFNPLAWRRCLEARNVPFIQALEPIFRNFFLL